MAINYDDERLLAVETEKQEALTQAEKTYGDMISKAEQTYQEQIDATEQWEAQQKQIQQEQTDFTVQQTEQQKAQAQKDYTKEQSAAWVDYQKQKNAYGAEAEQMAAAGLAGSGFSESARVSMYNTYQVRVAAARESMTQAIADYDNAIQSAMLQNNAALAEIAYQTLQQRLTLSLEGFQYQNQLILSLEEEKQDIDETYYSRYLDVLEQLNTEEALAIAQAQSGSGSGGSSSGEEEVYEIEGEEPVVEEIAPAAQTNNTKQIAKEVAFGDDGSGGLNFPGGKAMAMSKVKGNRKVTGQRNANTGSWRQNDRSGMQIVIDNSLKSYSEEELEEMIASGKVTVTQDGGRLLVKQKRATGSGNF